MDDTLARELAQDLRETRARLEAAQADAASLRVLLALRTRQHDLTWQAERRLAAELVAERARADALAAGTAGDAASRAGEIEGVRKEIRDLSGALAEAQERLVAAGLVLGAVIESLGRFGLDRRRFRALIARAGEEVPATGPGAARHAVLLTEARRVLGIRG